MSVPGSTPAANGSARLLGRLNEVAARVGWIVRPDGEWFRVSHPALGDREQGWKLHVSATPGSAEALLGRALPVLADERATFKVLACVERLAALNAGEGGLSQVGKFITVYPRDDAQAVRLASALDQATRGLRGPAIPGDRPFAAGSLVHYRYGAFGAQFVQSVSGSVVPALRDPQGELVPDPRGPVYRPPDWAVDPFAPEGEGAAPPAAAIGQRYYVLSTPHRSPRGAVHLGVDLIGRRPCVLKQAGRDARLRGDGTDARDALRHEAEVLSRLAPDNRFPTVFEVVEEADDTYLAMEQFEGPTLTEAVMGLAQLGRFIPPPRLVDWGIELASMLEAIHRAGLAYRDLRPANVILKPDRRLGLVDFELAQELNAAAPGHGGTRGYVSPQQQAGAPGAVADDVYALGAVLYFVATGADPAGAPDPLIPLERPLRALNPSIPEGVAAVVERCLEHDPRRRWASAPEVAAALANARRSGILGPRRSAPEPPADGHRGWRQLSRRLADSLCVGAAGASPGAGMSPPPAHGHGQGDLFAGPGEGVLLALAQLVDEFCDACHRAVLIERAHALAATPPPPQPLPGLYVGEGARAAALLRAGQVLSDVELLAAAGERGRRLAALPYANPDLTHGAAGRLRLHLLLWDESADPAHLEAAVGAGEFLLATAKDAGDGGVCWRVDRGFDPRGVEDSTPTAYLGYAHGAAGIADALLDLFEATGDERFRDAAAAAGAWLAGSAVPALDDGSGLVWPVMPAGPPAMAWCHGSTGIARFLLHAAALEAVPEAEALAVRAARAVARGARWFGPTQCHGLAGSIELMLDVAQSTREPGWVDEAASLAPLLEAFARERDGELVWLSPHPPAADPGYMLGLAGVAIALLRLDDPWERPTPVSRAGFRHRAHPRRDDDSAAPRPPGRPTVGEQGRTALTSTRARR